MRARVRAADVERVYRVGTRCLAACAYSVECAARCRLRYAEKRYRAAFTCVGAEGERDATPAHRYPRLHGLLFVQGTRDERRFHVPRSPERAAAELVRDADWLHRTGSIGDRELHAGAPAEGPDQAAGASPTGVEY